LAASWATSMDTRKAAQLACCLAQKMAALLDAWMVWPMAAKSVAQSDSSAARKAGKKDLRLVGRKELRKVRKKAERTG
jgi:hypothetical protein